MLSLKHSKIPASSSLKRLDDLAQEVLDLILEYVFESSNDQISSIVPASLTCRRLRASAIQILFKNLIIIADNYGLRQRSHAILRQLTTCPHLLKHVRRLHLLTPLLEDPRRPPDPESHLQGSQELIGQAFGYMTSLRHVRVDHVSSLVICLLRCIVKRPEIHITFDDHSIGHDTWAHTCIDDCRCLSTICHNPLNIMFPPPIFHRARKSILEFALGSPKIVALNCYQATHLVSYMADSTDTMSSLEELYISNLGAEASNRFITSAFVPWHNLRKLQLEGDRQVESLLPSIVDRLHSVTHLRLCPGRTTVFHENCPTIDPGAIHQNLAFTKLRSLKHLELFNVCNHLHLDRITNPNLRSLRIQLPEYAARLVGLESARSPSQIQWLTRNVINLQRLELHVGDLENLWHPTAIPGVDVDVEVYQCLQALASFRNLKQLRLFPHYVPKTAQHNYLNARQPLSDEQAVRIFRHLKAQCPSLQMLSIAATFEALWAFSPMAWTVRSHGDKVVLTTRQAGKNYEIEQIWIGERRVSMSNRRYTHFRPYLPDLGTWTYPLSKTPEGLHFLRNEDDDNENNDGNNNETNNDDEDEQG